MQLLNETSVFESPNLLVFYYVLRRFVLFDRVFAGSGCASFESGAFAQDLIFNTGHFLSSVFRNIIVTESIPSLLRLVPAVNI